jgi:hypothetical protein
LGVQEEVQTISIYSEPKEVCGMVAYEFYSLAPTGGYEIIGVLPERRRTSERVTKESINEWGKNIFGKYTDNENMFFIQVTIDDKTVRVLRPIPFSLTYEEISK